MNKTSEKVTGMRQDYSASTLDESQISDNPFETFEKWLNRAIEAKGVGEPHAFVIGTISDNTPRTRIVLLRGFDENGFRFYTNYESDKGIELEHNPNASMLFFWQPLQQQIRIEGAIEKVSNAESDEYFASRPRESQIGAWASDQSCPIDGRDTLEERVKHFQEKFTNQNVPRPEHWGGFRLVPEYFEFWQGRTSRLHDRIVFELDDTDNWSTKRLAP